MRVYALWLVIAFFSIRAYRDAFISVCALIALTAVSTHPDWPSNLLGIQGFNPWNVLLLNVGIAWVNQRRKEGLRWDMPGYVTVLLLGYGAVMLVGFARMIIDPSYMSRFSTGYLYGEYLINTFKFVVPGLILYDCCRTRERLTRALIAILIFYGVLALLVIKWMPPWMLTDGDALEYRALRVLVSGMGWHRVNLSAMLAGASWAILCATALWKPYRKYLWLAAGLVVYGQALTGGRAGYVAWAAAGLALATLRWRKLLLVLPVFPIVIVTFFPAVAQRAFEGIVVQQGRTQVDQKALTASRTMIWPYVTAQIAKHPWVGQGREAMVRSGLTDYLQRALNEEFAHPHNAYLQWLFDNGIIGAIPVALFYLYVFVQAIILMRARDDTGIAMALGGTTFTLLVALFVASLGSQTFYPREGAVPFWASMMITLRLARMRATVVAGEPARTVRSGYAAFAPSRTFAARGPGARAGGGLRPGQRFRSARPQSGTPAPAPPRPAPDVPPRPHPWSLQRPGGPPHGRRR